MGETYNAALSIVVGEVLLLLLQVVGTHPCCIAWLRPLPALPGGAAYTAMAASGAAFSDNVIPELLPARQLSSRAASC
jgi:hypothetical protein